MQTGAMEDVQHRSAKPWMHQPQQTDASLLSFERFSLRFSPATFLLFSQPFVFVIPIIQSSSSPEPHITCGETWCRCRCWYLIDDSRSYMGDGKVGVASSKCHPITEMKQSLQLAWVFIWYGFICLHFCFDNVFM